MFSLVSSKFLAMRNFTLYSVFRKVLGPNLNISRNIIGPNDNQIYLFFQALLLCDEPYGSVRLPSSITRPNWHESYKNGAFQRYP